MADELYVPVMSNCPPIKPDGRIGMVSPSDNHIQGLIDSVSDEIKARSDGRDYSNLKGINQRTQVIEGGANYYIKAQAQNGKQVHLKIHVTHPDLVNHLHAIQHDKTDDDEINAFD